MRVDRYAFSIVISIILLVAVLAWFMGWREQQESPPPLVPPLGAQEGALQPILPLEPLAGLDPERVALGERLFHDARLSADMTVSCASCHNLAAGGVDGRRFSIGVGGAVGEINAPTVLNSAYNLAQFWDGRAATLEAQAVGPIENPIEMAATLPQIVDRLAQDSDLVDRFNRLYADGLTADNLLNAIATFERSLVTVNSPFDRYLRGDSEALTAREVDGYRRFLALGCVSCHQGRLVGGNMYQKVGVMADYFAGRTVKHSDLGRFNVTGDEADRYVFKVPSLRNVALTAPYLHDGSAATLEDAVRAMGRYQLGRRLSDDDVEAIAAFLKTLTGELPAAGQ
ncbi:MAG: cytochrome-c peroxidase [Azonexus sp.]|jgi:cytochrome c peroxidase|nr:cytochrome-c peroxidase [Azonexus sp.]